MPSGEVTTDSLIRHALREKKTVFIPLLVGILLTLIGFCVFSFEKGDKQMNMLRLKDGMKCPWSMSMIILEDAFEKLATSLWGIPQHCSISDAATYSDDGSPNPLDLVIVPGS
jgi:5-formyltetrahydrofolate cyclo-ligase